MEQAVRPHRGGTVVALGVFSLISWLFFVPLGIVAWILGARDLKGMDNCRVDPSGRTLTQVGYVCGVVGSLLWLGMAGCTAIILGGSVRSSSSLMSDGTVTTQTYYSRNLYFGDRGPQRLELEYREVLGPNGALMKNGPARRWSRDGRKLEEGGYRDGKRDGVWTFWNEDGTIDAEKSGSYENDIKVGSASPPGDYPHPPTPPYPPRR